MEEPKKISAKITRPARIFLQLLAGLLLLVTVGYLGVAWYVHTHKQQVLHGLSEKLNENISGTLNIGGLEPAFLVSFPNIALRLENVVLRDSLYHRHKRTFMRAEQVDIAVNLASLLRGVIEIKKIGIKNARAHLYTDTAGYSNTSVFRQDKQPGAEAGSKGSFPELRKITLEKVVFVAENRKQGKLYDFEIYRAASAIRYNKGSWHAESTLFAMARSMAFSTSKGSFIKNKILRGTFKIDYNAEAAQITFEKQPLKIGSENFEVAASFKTGGPTTPFSISIFNKSIRWANAAKLLSGNITRKLLMFDMREPIKVSCLLNGDFDERGDPLIEVRAYTAGNRLKFPGGIAENCSFNGRFTNRYNANAPMSDANSAIILTRFSARYLGIPVVARKMAISNLDHPVAIGDASSRFDVSQLGALIDERLIKFGKGVADFNLSYKADIVDFQFVRPFVTGVVRINDAEAYYVPRKLAVKDVNLALYITKDHLSTNTITMKCGRSSIIMKGYLRNFLNLYYDSPERMVLNWDITTPALYLNDVIGFAGSRRGTALAPKAAKKSNARLSDGINFFFEKCNVSAKIRAGQIIYNKFSAKNLAASFYASEDLLVLDKAVLHHAGGTMALSGTVKPAGNSSAFMVLADIKRANVRQFFRDFDNFGMESLKSENLKGFLSSNTSLSGRLSGNGALIPGSLKGKVNFTLNDGALVNFAPVRNVAKFAFPFRDSRTITIKKLDGRFTVMGKTIAIAPMQVDTNILNMDVSGVYSFGRGTDMAIDVPLRNPENDKGITDRRELAERRHRGIVLHLTATDGEDGRVAVKLGKKNRE